MNKKLKHFLTLLTLFPMLTSVIVYASVFAYYPSTLALNTELPPLYFLPPDTANVYTSISPTGTSANVTIVGSNTVEIVENPDFYNGPDYWYFSSNGTNGNFSASWIPSDTGSSGGVVSITDNVNGPAFDVYGVIWQSVTFPSAPINQVTIIVRSRLAAESGFMLSTYVVGLYDLNTGTTIWSDTFSPSPSYNTFLFNVPSATIVPGNTYLFYVGAYVLFSFSDITIDLRIDNASIVVETAEYTFSGTAIEANVTDTSKPYYVRLVLKSYNTNPDLSAEIYLRNFTLHTSTPITVSGGAPVSTSTSWIKVSTPPPGYSAVRVLVEFTKTSTANNTLDLTLEYCTLPGYGACVYYPLSIVLDPVRVEPATIPIERVDTNNEEAPLLLYNIAFDTQPIPVYASSKD